VAGSISPRVRAGDRDIEAIAASLGPWHERRLYAPLPRTLLAAANSA